MIWLDEGTCLIKGVSYELLNYLSVGNGYLFVGRDLARNRVGF